MALFDTEAERYDSFYQTPFGSFVNDLDIKLVTEILKAKRNLNILDLGCGTGRLSVKLASLGHLVTGIDISDEMLNIARIKAKGEKVIIKFLNMDGHKLQFENESFDIVISLGTIEFLDEYEKVLKEIFRVVKKRGKILIGTINKSSKLAEMYMSDYYQKYSIYRYASFVSKEELLSYKKDKIIEAKEYVFIPPDSKAEEISEEREKELSLLEAGGLICVVWQK